MKKLTFVFALFCVITSSAQNHSYNACCRYGNASLVQLTCVCPACKAEDEREAIAIKLDTERRIIGADNNKLEKASAYNDKKDKDGLNKTMNQISNGEISSLTPPEKKIISNDQNKKDTIKYKVKNPRLGNSSADLFEIEYDSNVVFGTKDFSYLSKVDDRYLIFKGLIPNAPESDHCWWDANNIYSAINEKGEKLKVENYEKFSSIQARSAVGEMEFYVTTGSFKDISKEGSYNKSNIETIKFTVNPLTLSIISKAMMDAPSSCTIIELNQKFTKSK